MVTSKVDKAPAQAAHDHAKRMDRKLYEDELYRLQAELVKMQAWVSAQGACVWSHGNTCRSINSKTPTCRSFKAA